MSARSDSAALSELLKAHATGRVARTLDLRDENLEGLDLTRLRADGLQLSGANLRRAVLREVRWVGCGLSDTVLNDADLSQATLRMCELPSLRARKICAAGVRIENCAAQGAELEGADLSEASLIDSDFSRARLRGAVLTRVSALGITLRGADLTGASLALADLSGADLRGADLTNANLTDAVLRGADLRGAICDGTVWQGADLTGAKRDTAPQALPDEFAEVGKAVAPVVSELFAAMSGLSSQSDARLQELMRDVQNNPLTSQLFGGGS